MVWKNLGMAKIEQMTGPVAFGGIEPSVGPCNFCDLQQRERALIATDAGVVVPSVGALVPGWVLVVPRTHAYSTAEFDGEDRASFQALVERAKDVVASQWGPSVVFEHGSAGAGRLAGCGVDHAHVHVVPIDLDLRESIFLLGDPFNRLEWEARSEPSGDDRRTDYIWLHDLTGGWIARADVLPSQVVRRAIAKVIGVEIWDWKADPQQSNFDETLRVLGHDDISVSG